MRKLLVSLIVVALVFAVGCGASDEAVFRKGAVKDGVYTNEFAEVSFTLPEGWNFEFSGERNETVSNSDESVGDGMDSDEVDAHYFDCVARSGDRRASISFVYEDAEELGKKNPTAEQYCDLFIDDVLALFKEIAPESNAQRLEQDPVEIGGKTYYCGCLTIGRDGITEKQYHLIRKVGNKMLRIAIIINANATVPVEDIIAYIG